MISSEVQSALSQKADNWKVNNLEQDLSNLKNRLRDLESKLDYQASTISEMKRLNAQLAQLLIESELFNEDIVYQMHSIKNQ